MPAVVNASVQRHATISKCFIIIPSLYNAKRRGPANICRASRSYLFSTFMSDRMEPYDSPALCLDSITSRWFVVRGRLVCQYMPNDLS